MGLGWTVDRSPGPDALSGGGGGVSEERSERLFDALWVIIAMLLVAALVSVLSGCTAGRILVDLAHCGVDRLACK